MYCKRNPFTNQVTDVTSGWKKIISSRFGSEVHDSEVHGSVEHGSAERGSAGRGNVGRGSEALGCVEIGRVLDPDWKRKNY